MITLKTLEQSSAQEVFDQVVNHLRTQKVRSMRPNTAKHGSACMYRYNNLKCAAGCLIADDEYDSGWERLSWWELLTLGHVPAAHGRLIHALQQVHDRRGAKAEGGQACNWELGLQDTAKEFNLTYTPPCE